MEHAGTFVGRIVTNGHTMTELVKVRIGKYGAMFQRGGTSSYTPHIRIAMFPFSILNSRGPVDFASGSWCEIRGSNVGTIHNGTGYLLDDGEHERTVTSVRIGVTYAKDGMAVAIAGNAMTKIGPYYKEDPAVTFEFTIEFIIPRAEILQFLCIAEGGADHFFRTLDEHCPALP
jgi:hypothetical protein